MVKSATAISNEVYSEKLKEISDLNILPEYFRGPLKTLWRAAFAPRAAICPPLAHANKVVDRSRTFYQKLFGSRKSKGWETRLYSFRKKDGHLLLHKLEYRQWFGYYEVSAKQNRQLARRGHVLGIWSAYNLRKKHEFNVE